MSVQGKEMLPPCVLLGKVRGGGAEINGASPDQDNRDKSLHTLSYPLGKEVELPSLQTQLIQLYGAMRATASCL